MLLFIKPLWNSFLEFLCDYWSILLILLIVAILLIGIPHYWRKIFAERSNREIAGIQIFNDFFDGALIKDIYSELIGAAVFGLIIWLLQISLQEKMEELARPQCYFSGIMIEGNSKYSKKNEINTIEGIHVKIYDVDKKNQKIIGSDITQTDGVFKIPIYRGTETIKVVFEDIKKRYISDTIVEPVINWQHAFLQPLKKKNNVQKNE